MTVQLEEGKPLFQGQEMLPAYFLLKGFDLTNPDVQSVLKALAYRGLYAAVAAFESINYEGLDPHRVRLAIKDQSAAFHVLLGWFRKTSSKEVLTEAMEVLFNFQDKELDLSTKDIEEAKATSAIQELLRTDYFLNHALPNHTSALSLLAVLGHQRALDKLREVDPRVVEILEGQRLFEKANKGDKQALEEIISLAQQGRAQI